MKVYMAVDNSIYELPLFVGDNLGELSEWCGWSKAVTSSRISDNRSGDRLGFRLVRIELVDDEDDWKEVRYMFSFGSVCVIVIIVILVIKKK